MEKQKLDIQSTRWDLIQTILVQIAFTVLTLYAVVEEGDDYIGSLKSASLLGIFTTASVLLMMQFNVKDVYESLLKSPGDFATSFEHMLASICAGGVLGAIQLGCSFHAYYTYKIEHTLVEPLCYTFISIGILYILWKIQHTLLFFIHQETARLEKEKPSK